MQSKTISKPAIFIQNLWRLYFSPGILLLVLMVWILFLFIAEQFVWFDFLLAKGWPVLVAIASIVAVLATLFVWFVCATAFWGRFQFSIRSLLLLMFIVSLVSSWFASEIQQANKQKKALAALCRSSFAYYDYQINKNNKDEDSLLLGCKRLRYDYTARPNCPLWFEKLLGNDYFGKVDVIWLGPDATDADLEKIRDIKKLHRLILFGSNVTNAEIEKLHKALPDLVTSLGSGSQNDGITKNAHEAEK